MGDIVRTIVYIDGFNLYHAVKGLKEPHLKWVNLETLCKRFLSPEHVLVRITYCSAFATHDQGQYRRHQRFVEAQPLVVSPLMGRFSKNKKRKCKACGSHWKEPQEKESDVNLAVQIIMDAHKGAHDCSVIMSGDSDLVPAIQALRQDFPALKVQIIAPIDRSNTRLLKAAGLAFPHRMSQADLEHSLMPESVVTPKGRVIARPSEYDPPVAPGAAAGAVVTTGGSCST